MTKDTQIIKKVLKDPHEILGGLLAWRDYLWEKNQKIQGPDDPLVIINAILYKDYPRDEIERKHERKN